MPGLYKTGEYDLAGTIVGCAEKEHLITGRSIEEGDLLLGLPSTGLHTNGYSLARKLIFEIAGLKPESYVAELACTVGEALLAVHRSYLAPIQELHIGRVLHGAAHITGGGITGNLPRILPRTLSAVVNTSSWEIPPLFQMLRKIGNVPEDDFRRTFNLGIGMILVIPELQAVRAMRMLKRSGENPIRMGSIVKRKRGEPALRYE
jgi:phosphoribosylformylglycinamidine cyclo-ligase